MRNTSLLLGLLAALSPAPALAQEGANDTQIIQGVVEDIAGGDIVVRGESGRHRIGVFPSQVTGLERGAKVKVFTTPVLEGEQVTPLAMQRNPQGIRLTGTVVSVLEDVLILRVPEGGLREIRVERSAAARVQPGQEVIVDIDTGEQGLRALGILETEPPGIQ